MITSFSNENAFLSNFYPCRIYMSGYSYGSVEHAFQASKTLNIDERMEIRNAPTPGKAKRLGRRVQLRKDWESIKIGNMKSFLVQKFYSNAELKQKLIDTGDKQLIEGNNWGDKFWGMVQEDGQWVGENNLGKLLMEVRSILQNK